VWMYPSRPFWIRRKKRADIIALSALLTTSMPYMRCAGAPRAVCVKSIVVVGAPVAGVGCADQRGWDSLECR
jgi:hypothetical protein